MKAIAVLSWVAFYAVMTGIAPVVNPVAGVAAAVVSFLVALWCTLSLGGLERMAIIANATNVISPGEK